MVAAVSESAAEDQPLTAAEQRALLARVDELQAALERRDDATTPAAREDAADDVDDAERALRETAARYGLEPEQARKLIAEVREGVQAEVDSDAIRAAVREVMDEYAIEPPAGEGSTPPDGGEGGGDPPSSLADLRAAPDAPPPPPESTPPAPDPPADERPNAGGHWFHRKIVSRTDDPVD